VRIFQTVNACSYLDHVLGCTRTSVTCRNRCSRTLNPCARPEREFSMLYSSWYSLQDEALPWERAILPQGQLPSKADTCAAQPTPELPPDVLYEVFKRLECLRSLTRCRAVCSRWHIAASDERLLANVALASVGDSQHWKSDFKAKEASMVLSILGRGTARSVCLGTQAHWCATCWRDISNWHVLIQLSDKRAHVLIS
jgi:hypothetical protein